MSDRQRRGGKKGETALQKVINSPTDTQVRFQCCHSKYLKYTSAFWKLLPRYYHITEDFNYVSEFIKVNMVQLLQMHE